MRRGPGVWARAGRLGGALERRALRRAADDPAPGMLVVFPDDWAAADRAAFAGGGDAAWAEAVERNTGGRPGPRTLVIAFPERPDGPR